MRPMSAAAYEDHDAESVQPLSALEEAMRRALESYSREQVLERVVRVLPTGGTDPDAAPRPGLHGKVEKVSVSLPSELIQAIRARIGAGGFSRYVADAVQERFHHDQLGDLLDELEADHVRVPDEIREQTRRLWPDRSE
jgi:Arc/MetJ-type ribon-helix-helix transcriptional regulator